MANKKMKVKLNAGNEYISFNDAFEEFIIEKEALNLAPKTIRNYRQSLEYFIEFEFDGDINIDISNLSKIYVEQWKAAKLKEGMSITTINHYLRDVRVFLYWCMDDERKYIEPRYIIDCIKGQEKLPKIFSDEDVDTLLQKPNNIKDWVEWRTWGIVNWVVGTGNRAATVCGLKIGDVDFLNEEVRITTLKTKKVQILKLSPTLNAAMKLYINKCRYGEPEDAWLFPRVTNEQLSYEALAHSFRKYCLDRGVSITSIHALRHYFGTTMARNNYNRDKLQKVLGHSTYNTTKKYIDMAALDIKEDDFDECNPLDNLKKAGNKVKKVNIR
jgi:integrase/recombinase XerD